MKGKAFTYVLGLLVLVVWGVIIYRIVGSLNGDKDSNFQPAERVVKEKYNDFEVVKDTSKLMLNYRDPFGMVAFKDTAAKPLAKNVASAVGAKAVQPAFNWGFIKYAGYVRSSATKKMIAVMIINGKTAMMAEGETVEKVTLVKNLQDSVKVTFNHKSTYIKID